MKLTIIIAILFAGSLIFLASCSSTQKALTQEQVADLPKVLAYSKGGCKGRCPIFDLTVYENGWMIFDGKMWTKQKGKAMAQLTKEAFALLQTDCEKADLWSKEPAYGMNIMDAPTTTIHLFEKGRDMEVKWRIRAPKALPDLSEKIMKIIMDKGWIEGSKVEMRKKKLTSAIDSELIIQFKAPLDARKWCAKYARYGMAVKRTLSTMTPLYLMQFDATKIRPEEMLKLVKKQEQVVNAEFNKRMESSKR